MKKMDFKISGWVLERELGVTDKKRIFLLIDLDNGKSWADVEGLPDEAFFCASFDGVPMVEKKCGENVDFSRCFLPLDWLVEEWGGPEDFVAALSKRREMTNEELPSLREKYEDMKPKEDEKKNV